MKLTEMKVEGFSILRIGRKLIINRKIILMICLFTSIDTLLFGTNSSSYMVLVPRIMAVIGIFMLIDLKAMNKKQFICWGILCLIVFSSCMFHSAEFNTTVSKLLFITLGFAIANRFCVDEFFDVFDQFMFLVAIFAILIEVVSYVSSSLVMHFVPISNEAGSIYYSVLLSSVMSKDLNTMFIRSCGVFWEPGAFAVYLVLAVMGQLFVKSTPDFKKVIIYIICVAMTFSTTGVVSLGALFITFLLKKKKVNAHMEKRIRNIIIVTLVMFGLFFLFSKNSPVYEKLFGKISNNTSTTQTRVASIIVPFYIVYRHPLLGVSPNYVADYMVEYAKISHLGLQSSKMCTNTATYQFAAYGVFYGLVFLWRNICFMHVISRRRVVVTVGLLATVLFAYTGENFYSFLPYVLLFLSFRDVNNTMEET